MPATPGIPKIAEIAKVAALTPTEAPRLWPKKRARPPISAEAPHRSNTCKGFASAINASANRQTKMAQVIT